MADEAPNSKFKKSLQPLRQWGFGAHGISRRASWRRATHSGNMVTASCESLANSLNPLDLVGRDRDQMKLGINDERDEAWLVQRAANWNWWVKIR